jgi:nucleoside-diphosphate-sugar epimerase
VKALVTVATGFTGGHLARALARRGSQVRALVRNPDAAADLAAAGIELVKGDLERREDLTGAARGVDVVYHVAALYRQAGLPEATYHRVNAESAGWIVDAAAAAARVASSTAAPSASTATSSTRRPTRTRRPGRATPQVTKLEGERLARAAAERTGIELVIVRPSGIYGPSDRGLKLFRGVARRRFVVLGDGEIFYI